MAEFCLECWNKINESNHSKWRYVLSWNKELCEECGQYKKVVIIERFWSRSQRTLSEVIGNVKNTKHGR